ncbi:hypothetical protein STM14_1572 [Salmonella enterica subsp. enterica serovar Typhimurium str. 14028S]|uniref:Uncharacterized protein n=2 Tax=Salmonella enterica I TaxID=59201 RepID=A0A0F6B0M4_SALT1|nr:hypothetical protein SPAB_02050 [Salmonella enterica subsp. enterica serovar Paratyphi B str. SPB7]ACY88051.1 hypothetical protein STM14_1572 [Salmonella enterica subsp. enterica serovar Typhimurium str. 14028S]
MHDNVQSCREGRINDYRMAAMSRRRHPVWLLMKH